MEGKKQYSHYKRYYDSLSPEEKRRHSQYNIQRNREKIKKVTVGLSHEMDAALTDFISRNGYKSKNAFIIELIKKEIGYEGK